MKKKASHQVVPIQIIEHRIYVIRGHKAMLDSDLGELYGVPTKVLVQAVKRNRRRFPSDFMYQLDNKEVANLRSQFVTSKEGRGGRRYPPYAFTEQGVAMLSSVLNSEKAIQVNIAIMRTFVKLREMVTTQKELAKKLAELELRIDSHGEDIRDIFEAIYELMKPRSTDAVGFQITGPSRGKIS